MSFSKDLAILADELETIAARVHENGGNWDYDYPIEIFLLGVADELKGMRYHEG